jgi:hypothetical protein
LETIEVPINIAFDYIQPVPLSILFPGYHNIPAIIETDETEKWIKAGLSRIVTFEDGYASASDAALQRNSGIRTYLIGLLICSSTVFRPFFSDWRNTVILFKARQSRIFYDLNTAV